MCKPFPLFRCTDDTEKKIVKLTAQTRVKENQLSEVDNLMTQIATDLPEGEADNDAAYVTLRTQREKLLADVATIEDKRREELLQYAATAGGQKELDTKAHDETVPPFERMEAATDKAAGAERRAEQKELAKILSSSELTSQEKALYAQQEVDAAEKTIHGLKRHLSKSCSILAELQDQILQARAENDIEGLQELVARRDRTLTEISYLEKKIKQKKLKQKELNRWLTRLYTKGVMANVRITDSMIRGFFKLL